MLEIRQRHLKLVLKCAGRRDYASLFWPFWRAGERGQKGNPPGATKHQAGLYPPKQQCQHTPPRTGRNQGSPENAHQGKNPSGAVHRLSNSATSTTASGNARGRAVVTHAQDGFGVVAPKVRLAIDFNRRVVEVHNPHLHHAGAAVSWKFLLHIGCQTGVGNFHQQKDILALADGRWCNRPAKVSAASHPAPARSGRRGARGFAARPASGPWKVWRTGGSSDRPRRREMGRWVTCQ